MSDDNKTEKQGSKETTKQQDNAEMQIQEQPLEIEKENKDGIVDEKEEKKVVEEVEKKEPEMSPEEQKKLEGEIKQKKAQKELEEAREEFRPGDTIKVYTKVKEGKKERIQAFQGIVLAKKGRDISKTFTVRKIAVGRVGVERIWPLFSSKIVKIDIVQRGKSRRAKLYYMRDRIGKAAMAVKKR